MLAVASTPSDVLCDDGNATTDTCDEFGDCSFGTVTCDDSVPCTLDSCDETDGCTFVALDVNCDDGLICTVDFCDEITGCGTAPVTCDDGIDCTNDECVEGEDGGCEFTVDDTQCDDGDGCTDDFCDGTTGCETTPVSCDDGINCTVDTCEIGSCVNELLVCDDGMIVLRTPVMRHWNLCL